jgi:hypothetical protein
VAAADSEIPRNILNAMRTQTGRQPDLWVHTIWIGPQICFLRQWSVPRQTIAEHYRMALDILK